MFMNKKNFTILEDGIEGFFYFSRKQIIVAELKEKKLFCYQINSIKTKTIDTTVKIKDKKVRENWQSLLRWHLFGRNSI